MRKAAHISLLIGVLIVLMVSCASIGTPSGGPRDEDPPRFITSSPEQGAVEVTPNKVVLTFNELVNVKDAFNKVVVSPPSAQTPRVSSLGRRVTVEFRDTLLPNTTYTVDFGDAIVDNNEGNKLENFIFTFSTGPQLDSLMISGMVLGAEDLEPPAGIYVGLHTNLEDSAFRKSRFERIAKTDENGKFVIGGLAPGSYRIYALEDKDNDLKWSSPEESLAFYDFVLQPTSEQTVATDSIIDLKTGEVDTIVQRTRTRFLPNNILLRSYNTGFKQQYITKYERIDSTRISLVLNTASEEMPKVEIVQSDRQTIPFEEIAVLEKSATNDTLLFWLKNPEIISRDTLKVAVSYLKADSAYNMMPVYDTLRFLTQRPIVKAAKADKEKTKKGKEEVSDSIVPEIPTVAFKSLGQKPEVNQVVTLEVATPLETFDPTMVHLEFKEDSVWYPVKDFDVGMVIPDTLNPRRLRILYPWDYETNYKLTVDSLAGKDIYGIYTDDYNFEFTTRAESEYGSIKLNLANMGSDTIPRFVQLLNAQGNPVATEILEDSSVTFSFLLPGKYNVRVVEDYNGNGRWDPGNFDQGVQPDISYYYSDTIDLKANWDQEIDWNVFAVPVDRMKPESLRKTKKNQR